MRCHSCELPSDDLVEVVGGAVICRPCYEAQYELMPLLKRPPRLEDVMRVPTAVGAKPGYKPSPDWYGNDEAD